MPGVLTSLSVATAAGHHVGVATGNNTSDLSVLRSLECIHCGSINYNGRKIEGCNHTVCQPCMDKDDSLKTGKHECNGSVVTDKKLIDYSMNIRVILDNLTVFCSVDACNQQAKCSEIDRHIGEHASTNSVHYSAGEIRVANNESELPPDVVWYEHEGYIYYIPDPDAQ